MGSGKIFNVNILYAVDQKTDCLLSSAHKAYYLDLPLACESVATEALPFLTASSISGVRISRLSRGAYPVNGFVFELEGTSTSTRLEEVPGAAAVACPTAPSSRGGKWLPPLLEAGVAAFSEAVGAACQRLQHANVPHNLLIVDAGRKVFLWPQCFAERMARGEMPERVAETGVNPAVFEIAGHLLLKRAQDYDDDSSAAPAAKPGPGPPGCDEAFAAEILAQASLPEDRFLEVARMCLAIGK